MNTAPELLRPPAEDQNEPVPDDFRQAYLVGYLSVRGYGRKEAEALAKGAALNGLAGFYDSHTTGLECALGEVLELCKIEQ